MAVRFILFDRWDQQICTIADIVDATWTEELNGEDTLEITTTEPIAKGNRIVWCDGQGLWHEHIATSVQAVHDASEVLYVATCENSISELYGDYIMDKRPNGVACQIALTTALDGSRWTTGEVTVKGTASTNFYRESCRSAVQKVIETWGGELSTTISVSATSIVSRKVNITRRGASFGRRFEYRRGMKSIKRTFDADDVVSALYGYGKGEEVGDGYGRRIDFADINNGKQYVGDASALNAWGRPDGKGGKAHVFGQVVFDDCEDRAELLRLTKAELNKRKVPKVSYEAEVETFSYYGYSFGDVGLGDDVNIVDDADGFDVHVSGRVTKIVRDMLDKGKATSITIGNIIEDAADLLAGQHQAISDLKSRSSSWDVAASTPSSYLNRIIDGLNTEFELAGSYKYESPEIGTICSNVPLDSEFKPTSTPASAIQIKGGMFRVADKLNADGSWDWRTFGTGSGFVADMITTGILNASLIKAGILQWGDNYIDLENGTCRFAAATTTLDGKNIATSDTVQALDNALGQVELFNRLTNGGETQGIYMQDGKLYLNAAYVAAGVLADAAGKNSWNLRTGALSTNSMKAYNIDANGRLTNGKENSYQVKVNSGEICFYYGGAETIRMVSLPNHTTGEKGGCIQADHGATFLGLRAPRLYTAKSTSVSGTTGYTGNHELNYVSKIENIGDGRIQWTNSKRNLHFLNGFCTVCNFD